MRIVTFLNMRFFLRRMAFQSSRRWARWHVVFTGGRAVALFIAALIAITARLGAQEVCPCFPNEKMWIITACETWDCAMTGLQVGNGDPFVVAMPTNSTHFPWIVMRRVTSGTVVVSPDNPFLVETFSTIAESSARYAAVDSGQLPMIVSTTDSKVLVIYLRAPEPRHRAAGR